jgi:hypothetical protein
MAYERTPRPDIVVNKILNKRYDRNIQTGQTEKTNIPLYEYKTPSSYQSLSGRALTPVGRNVDLQGMSVPPVRLASRPTNITEGPGGNIKNNITSQTVINTYLSENPGWLSMFGDSDNPISNNEY